MPAPKRVVLPEWVRLVREPIKHATMMAKAVTVRDPETIVNLLRPLAEVEDVEVFWVLTLDSQSRVTGVHECTRGLLDASLVHPREVFRIAIANGAAGIIVAHNHPSGDPTPSAEDRSVTRQLYAAGQLLDMPLYDHIILGGADKHISFSEAGLLA